MRVTQVRQEEKPPEQRVTLRIGTELGHKIASQAQKGNHKRGKAGVG